MTNDEGRMTNDELSVGIAPRRSRRRRNSSATAAATAAMKNWPDRATPELRERVHRVEGEAPGKWKGELLAKMDEFACARKQRRGQGAMAFGRAASPPSA